MKSESRFSSARDYLSGLAAAGRYHFVSSDARAALGVSADAVKLALNRLKKQGLIASPARGFYVIVPPEYRSLGCLPADQFIPALMNKLGLSYYAALLTAAQYHGAAHQRPQVFQVFVERRRRRIQCGKVRVAFVVRKNVHDVPVQSFNTPRGTVLVSTPEATALDLIGHQKQAGGLDLVATVLTELAHQIRADKLPSAAEVVPIPWAQRLGYLLDHVGASERTTHLKDFVREHARQSTSLLPGTGHKESPRNADWKLYVNASVAPEL